MTAKQGVNLNQVLVLPHVETGVIDNAQQAIADLRWSDDSDNSPDDLDLDLDGDALSTPAYSLLTTRSLGSTYSGRNGARTGGLSPPRAHRPVIFANFDGHHGDQMTEDVISSEPGDARLVDGYSSRKTSFSHQRSFSVQDIDMTELSRQLAGYAPQTARTIGTSPFPGQAFGDMDQNGVSVPVRHSSKQATDNGNGYSQAHDVASPDSATRSRFPIICEEDDHDSDEHENDHEQLDLFPPQTHYKVHSNGHRPVTVSSSTPPPIRNSRPNRILVYDEFPEDDGGGDHDNPTSDTDADAEQQHRPSHESSSSSNARRRPPVSSRNTEQRRLGSMSSASTARTPKTQQQPRGSVRGSPMSGVHGPHNSDNGSDRSRTTTLTMNYRDARTPKLNHLLMYHDAAAATNRPLMDRLLDGAGGGHFAPSAAARGPPNPRVHRSFENSLNSTYAAAGGGAASGGHMAPKRSMSQRRTYSDDGLSIRQASVSGRSAVSQSAVPDFFSTSIFNVVLHNPTTAHQLRKFSETRLCAENVDFLNKVDEYRHTLNTLASQMAGIHKTFISPESHSQINVNGVILRQTHKEMKSLINNAFPSMETVFQGLQEQIETLVFQDIYPSFVRHQVALSASKALASNRFQYQGLGDCFTLTDPTVADNPIRFASDGFVKVTGYTRSEIIPRNCRFLQGLHTDRAPVIRIKQAVEQRKETVELLLNYKKNGEPFWNLLYVAPLYNSKGQVQFFIGGQVNCSTTIHSNVDVMKVLSVSDKDDVEENESLRAPSVIKQQSMKPSARRALLKAFGVRLEGQSPLSPTGDAGMEDGLLNRMEGQDLGTQMKEFYTAYSKYLVVRASTYAIEFYSDGIVETLNPANLTSGIMFAGNKIAGIDVFRFLGNNMLTKQPEYKNRVRGAMRAGTPTSTPLRLQTHRSAVFRGDEPFVAHWTPLKDENATVQWIVVTLAPVH